MKPNILFITFDSLRSDKFFGKDKTAVTPNIDSIINNGVYFTQTIASTDSTILALNSIFNATFPFDTGVRIWKIILQDKNYIQFLKKQNYNIYGLIPDLTSFSSLSNMFENDDKTFHALPPYAINPLISNGEKIISNITSKKMREPWLYYIHSLDLHFPVVLPEEFNERRFGKTKYDRMLSAIDPWIGKILEKIDMKNTLIVITADHGQHMPFDEKGTKDFEPEFKTELKIGKKLMPHSTHKIGAKMITGLRNRIRDSRLKKANEGLTPYQKRSRLPHTTLSVFDETVCVPLLFAGYRIHSKIVSEQVRSVDIFPTITDLIQLPKRQEKFHGRSLVPFLEDKKMDELPAYIHTTPHVKITSDDKVGIRTSKYKYFRGNNQEENVNLYNLHKDPQENINIASKNPEIVKEMEGILEKLTAEPISIDDEEISHEETKRLEKELRKLGYIEEDEEISYEEVNLDK